MKDIKTLLKEAGVEIADDKFGAFDKAFKENYKTVAEVQKIETARDNYKSQLETAQESLKKFDGVDADGLKAQVKQLQDDLANKENEYKKKISDMEFNSSLDSILSKSGAKNVKAVKSLLDIDALKESKNIDSDIQKAIDAVKEENDYMFTSEEPHKNPVGSTGTKGSTSKVGSLSGVEAAFYAKNPGLKPE